MRYQSRRPKCGASAKNSITSPKEKSTGKRLRRTGRTRGSMPENADEYAGFIPIQDMFDLYTVGVKTNRDDVVYDWNRETLAARMKAFIESV